MQKLKLMCDTTPHERRCKKCQTDKCRCSWRGRSREVIEGEVAITHKRYKGELVSLVDESLSGDEVQEVGVPRGKLYQLYLALQLIKRSGIHRSMTGTVDSANGRTVGVAGKGTSTESDQGNTEGGGGWTDMVQAGLTRSKLD
jgi:hypothetical protein